MLNKPMTIEYALERLDEALKSQDSEEIAKWDFIIRAENDWRIKCKQRDREMKDNLLRLKLKEMYRLPN